MEEAGISMSDVFDMEVEEIAHMIHSRDFVAKTIKEYASYLP